MLSAASSSSSTRSPSPSSSPETYDASNIDYDALLADLKELRRELESKMGDLDLAHLRKIERIGRAATAFGVATAWTVPNPLTMAALALGRSTRWLLMHHIGHRGYDKVPGVPARYTSKVFARGSRRFIDWADWMIPEAWIYEHNVLHHSHTGEEKDPDLVERNTEWLRKARLPLPLKYMTMLGLAVSWRFSYYAPNTLEEWLDRHAARGDDGKVDGARNHRKELWLRCYLPYATGHFVLFPLLYLPLGPLASLSALLNSLGGEALTNLHTFCVVGPNHTGDDLYRYDSRPGSKGEAIVRQILGSTNYATGGDLVDYAHLWLNYQIEHHIFPDLPMLRYRDAAPRVKALCEKHGIPYPQSGILSRVKKLLDVAVGKTSMKRVQSLGAPHEASACLTGKAGQPSGAFRSAALRSTH